MWQDEACTILASAEPLTWPTRIIPRISALTYYRSENIMPKLTSHTVRPTNRCHFLRLPRELRDLIYAYTPHEPKGVYYCRDEDYQAHFCSSDGSKTSIKQLN